ncbi:BASIC PENTACYSTEINE7-like protein, partial [Drosera capensis]
LCVNFIPARSPISGSLPCPTLSASSAAAPPPLPASCNPSNGKPRFFTRSILPCIAAPLSSEASTTTQSHAQFELCSLQQITSLRMGTFRTTDWMMSEANRETPAPFTWFYPENFLSSARTSESPFQATEIRPALGFTTFPFQYAGLVNEAMNYTDLESYPAHTSRKENKKSSEEASDELVAVASKHKRMKKDKKPKKKVTSEPVAYRERRNPNTVVYSTDIDLSGVPPPVCTCTGVPRQCYRWGAGRWQSSCCTTSISHYPLPMSTSRPGNRVPGRKMSRGAYEKLLQRLAAEGYDLSRPVDLRLHWARHGTNKYLEMVEACTWAEPPGPCNDTVETDGVLGFRSKLRHRQARVAQRLMQLVLETAVWVFWMRFDVASRVVRLLQQVWTESIFTTG